MARTAGSEAEAEITDVLSDLLRRADADTTTIRQVILRPPWAFSIEDSMPLSLLAVVDGRTSVQLANSAPTLLASGDIALITARAPYTVADSPRTAPEVLVRDGRKLAVDGGVVSERLHRTLAPRTYGDGLPGSTTTLRGAYRLRGEVGKRLLDMLPPLAVIPAGPRTRGALQLLATEVPRDEPGQDAVLHRLLDLVLVVALRAWCARPEQPVPAWYSALADPAIGDALQLLHDDPAHRWTIAELAAKIGMSRAAFAARFTRMVGEPPLAYLTGWRMTLAADHLRDPHATVATVARQVGYADPFAFSVAFKRARGVSPSVWRQQP